MAAPKFIWKKRKATVFAAYHYEGAEKSMTLSTAPEGRWHVKVNVLAVKRYDQIEVTHEYVPVARPDQPVWYYGHVASSPKNIFPDPPPVGIIPASYVVEMAERDLVISDENQLKSELVALSYVWPDLITKKLASSKDLMEETKKLNEQVTKIREELYEVERVVRGMEGNYDTRNKEHLMNLSLRVDNFSKSLHYRDILVRDDSMRIAYEAGNMTDYHTRLIKRRDNLTEIVRKQKTVSVPASIFQASGDIFRKDAFLLIKLESFKYPPSSVKDHWLRICVYAVDASHKASTRPTDLNHEAFLIPVTSFDQGVDDGKAVVEIKDLGPLVSLCLFENLKLRRDSKILVFCDLLVQNTALEVIATTPDPAYKIDLNEAGLVGTAMDGYKNYQVVNFQMTSTITENSKSGSKHKTSKADMSIQHNVAGKEGRFVSQFVVGSRKTALSLFNLTEDETGKSERLFHSSRPINIPPRNSLSTPLELGKFVNQAHLRLRKVLLPKKEKERRLVGKVQLVLLRDVNEALEVIPNAVSLGAGGNWLTQYYTPTVVVSKGKTEANLDGTDLVKFDLKEYQPHNVFILFSFFKENHEASEFEFFLPVATSLCQNSFTTRQNGIHSLQGYASVTKINSRSLIRMSPSPAVPVGGPQHKRSSTSIEPVSADCKITEERLDIELCIQCTIGTDSQDIVNLFHSSPDEALYYKQVSALGRNFPSALWVLPHVLSTVMNYLADSNDSTNAMVFLVDLLIETEKSHEYPQFYKYLSSDTGGFLNILANSSIWRVFMKKMVETLKEVIKRRDIGLTSGGGGSLTTSPQVTPADMGDPVDLKDEMKFLSVTHFIWPWTRQSLSLDMLKADEDKREKILVDFATLAEDMNKQMMEKLNARGDEEHKNLARFFTHAFIEFPHFHEGLKQIRKVNLQIENIALCYTSKHLRVTKYRRVFHKIVGAILAHTVHVSSGLKKYYAEFSNFLQDLVRYYHAHVADAKFNLNASDVNFLLVVFENVQFWLESGEHRENTSSRPDDNCNRILSAAVQFIQLVSSLNLADIHSGDVIEFARTIRQVLKTCSEVLLFAAEHLPDEYLMMKVLISLEIYKFLYREESLKSSVFNVLMERSISPEESCEQYIYVFELLLEVCHHLVISDHFKLENFNNVRQNIVKKCIECVDQPDKYAREEEAMSAFLDIRHGLAHLLVTLHNSIIWPLVLERPIEAKFFGRPYPMSDVLHMSLSSPERYTLSSFCEILADNYCLLTTEQPEEAFSELVREVDTFIGFKHKMGGPFYVDRFGTKLHEKINSSSLITDSKAKDRENRRIDSITSVQMKDLLNIRSSAEEGLDPDLLILYTSDLLKFYAGDKLYKLDVDLSSNVLFIRYHMRIFTLNMEFGNETNAAETLMEFVVLLERFDSRNASTRPNSVEHLKYEMPEEFGFYKPGFTTVEMSIELLKFAAELYENQKLYEAADYARDQMNNFYYRNLDYEGIARNNIHRAELACKIKGVNFNTILTNEQEKENLTTGPQQRRPSVPTTPVAKSQNLRMIHTRGFSFQFYLVKFPRQEKENGIIIPKVFEGKTFIYSRENLLQGEFENYLRSLFPDCHNLNIVREEHGKTPSASDIVYAQLQPQLWLPKRFKMQWALAPGCPDVEFYRTHSISVFEKRIQVKEVDKLQHIQFEDSIALQMFTVTESMPQKERDKQIREWKKSLREAAVFGMKVTKYKLAEKNLVVRTETETYPGKCRWQPIYMTKPGQIKYSCEIAKDDLMEFIQTLTSIYFKYVANQGNPCKQLEILSIYMEIVSKIVSPIQGGLKKQCLAFLSPQYREAVGRDVVRTEFEKYLKELLRCLTVISETIELFVESNRDDEALRTEAGRMSLLESAASQFYTHVAGIFNDDIVKQSADHAAIMDEVKAFLMQEHLSRIMKSDPCIHDNERKFTSDDEGHY